MSEQNETQELNPAVSMTQCKICGKSFQRIGAHMKRSHPESYGMSGGKERSVVGNSSSALTSPVKGSAPAKVRFVSTRSPGLTVVIKPVRQGFINTPAGSVSAQLDGKRVHFIKGVLETDDPEVIEYLRNDYHDPRFPVTCTTDLGAR